MSASPHNERWLQFLVVLAGVDPVVWRRIVVPATYTFWDLHVAIQDAMGWQDYHLHSFQLVDPDSSTLMTLGIPDPDEPDSTALLPGWTHRLEDYASPLVPPFLYSYDFGDDWQHAVVFEGYARPPGTDGPACVGGAQACPPEDCGGAGGYHRMLEAVANPEDEQHRELIEWLGGSFDPNAFSIEDVEFRDPRELWLQMFDEGAA